MEGGGRRGDTGGSSPAYKEEYLKIHGGAIAEGVGSGETTGFHFLFYPSSPITNRSALCGDIAHTAA
jgi:hypothetical protein